MPERMEWAVRAVYIGEAALDEGELMYFEGWEPFGVSEDYVFVKKEVLIEPEEKSSVHHEMSFAQRYEQPDPED